MLAALRPVPVIDGTPEDLLVARREDALILLTEGRRIYGRVALAAADRIARWWLARSANPLLEELDRMRAVLDRDGLHMLNLSYEWGCTTAAFADGRGARLLRTLDWPFRNLGARLAVLRQKAPAGVYFNVTWAGFAGVLTAMAPGRFSLAINQAKMLHGRLTRLAEWPLTKRTFLSSRALPPAHLLRLVCDHAKDYAEAQRMLRDTPVCLPVFFTLAGMRSDEHCVIERLPNRSFVRTDAAIIANHWQFPGVHGDAPGILVRFDEKSRYIRSSQARFAGLKVALEAPSAERPGIDWSDFNWLVPPVLARDTKLAFTANAATGEMALIGIEDGVPATAPLHLTA